MLCGNQSVAAISSFTVAPSFRPISSRIAAFLVPWRVCLVERAAFLRLFIIASFSLAVAFVCVERMDMKRGLRAGRQGESDQALNTAEPPVCRSLPDVAAIAARHRYGLLFPLLPCCSIGMMFCNYCGSPNPDDFVYCSSCGRDRKPAGYSEPKREASPPARPPKKPLTRTKAYLHLWLYWLGAWLLIGLSLWLIQSLFNVKGDAVDTLARIAATLSLTVWSWCAWILAGRKVTPRKKDSKPSRFARWSTKSLYTALVIELSVAAIGLLEFALTIFDTCVSIQTGVPVEKTKTPDYSLPIVFLGLWLANGTWKEIVKREPGAAYGRQQKRIRVAVAIGICAVLAVFGISGYSVGRHRNEPVKALQKRVAELRPATDRFKTELSRIRSADVSTVEDYHNNCLKLEALLDGSEPVRKETGAIFDEFGRIARDRPAVLGIAALMRSFGEKEDQVFSLLRDEISHSKKLVEQPPHKQEAYYARYIQPIQADIAKLAEEEGQLLKQAQQQRAKLPPGLAEMLR
jgi:hypothetical protein